VAGLVLITKTYRVRDVQHRRRRAPHRDQFDESHGAQDGRVAGLFLFEAAAIGLAGGLIGYFFGLALAIIVGRTVFESVIAPAPLGFPGTALIALAVAFLASMLPVRRALAVDPVKTLRGE
jgi:putative ABC transport system permease protein